MFVKVPIKSVSLFLQRETETGKFQQNFSLKMRFDLKNLKWICHFHIFHTLT